MREESSRIAISITVEVGDGVLSGRMARASRARRDARTAGEMCGRIGVERVADIAIGSLEDGDDSASKRAEKTAESFGVSPEVGAVVVIAVITLSGVFDSLEMNRTLQRIGPIPRRDLVRSLTDWKGACFYPLVADGQ